MEFPLIKFSHLHYYYLSLHIIFSLFIFSNSTDLSCDSRDAAVLLKIKSHFGGGHLFSDWDSDITCCEWDYVGCSGDRVNGLTFSAGSGLSGEIPAFIGDLPYLSNIIFSGESNLSGHIPKAISKLKYLQNLQLNSNNLTGSVPELPVSLTNLDISHNKLSGSLPRGLGKLPLTSIDVSFNQLCGSIPSGLSKFGSSSFENNKCLCGSPLSACK